MSSSDETTGVYTVADVETTTHNKGHPFDPRNKLVSYAFDSPTLTFKYHTDPDFTRAGQDGESTTVVGFNFKFDLHWFDGIWDFTLNPVWDCQLAEHVYTGQRAQFVSLDECLTKYGLATKKDLVKEYWEAGVQTDEIPVPILKEYNCWDVEQTKHLFHVQQTLLSDEQKNLVYIMGEDLKVLAHIERSGLLFDRDGAEAKLAECKASVAAIEEQLAKWLPNIVHGVFNWDSGDHLSCFLYGGVIEFDWFTETPAVYKSGEKKGQEYTKRSWFTEQVRFPGYFQPLEGTEVAKTKDKPEATTRFYQTDGPTLASLRGRGETKRILVLLSERAATQKVGEMLESLFNQFTTKLWQGNLVHGQYNQNVAVTGRLSSSAPNMQNIPPEIDKFFISRYD